MTLHLLRPAVGIESTDHLVEVFRKRAKPGPPPGVFITTRNVPRRQDELADRGSVYWIIKGQIRARSPIQRVEELENDKGKRYCHIWLEPQPILTVPQPRRPMQGWRYLKPEDAPADLPRGEDGEMPAEMAAELKELGLI